MRVLGLRAFSEVGNSRRLGGRTLQELSDLGLGFRV